MIQLIYYSFEDSFWSGESIQVSSFKEKYEKENPGKSIDDLKVYEDEAGINDHWFFVLSSKHIFEAAMKRIAGDNSQNLATTNTKVYKKGDTYEKALKRYTEVKKKEAIEENSEIITSQVEKLQSSKIHYLFNQIQTIAVEKKDKLRKKLLFTLFKIGQVGTDTKDMGKILNKSKEIKDEISKLGLDTSDTTDVIFTNI